MIPARRRYEYASGYLALGMIKDAARELQALVGTDADSAEALQLWIALRHETKQWEPLVTVARRLARLHPDMEQGWVSWAYALRELERIEEAQAVLREAEPQHGESCAVLHYNLGCYACLLGDRDEARRRLERAFSMDPEFKDTAAEDPDLASMRGELK
jgi:tetratricopeptide (TPR) repeat protein